jgi:hypothetical protein
MTRRSRFTIPLSEEDRLEITIEKEGGTVTDFVMNYVATIAGRDHSVVRYDTNHGIPTRTPCAEMAHWSVRRSCR